MQTELWSIGKANEAYVEEGIRLFSGRLRHYTDFSLRIIPPPRNAQHLPIPEQKRQEARLVEQQCEKTDYLVALDEGGKQMSTLQLADFLRHQQNSSLRRLIFLIGGAHGLDAAVLSLARARLSLSDLTFPHQLVRLIMTEQLYRAFTVLRNEKYHHQ
ncbi:23S rRNA (pseudouridine(1915)-N(3))-methyltransferase RlmH [Compostibacter hankyongensis]|uniref:Ribosomal RNA large subunit methyltransferase H n=1 Tax=Compostibacter hankyongensis TaxID=1007089 RepID=A0ABP8FLY4_9BACT